MKKILWLLVLLCNGLLYAQQQPGDLDTPYAYVNSFVDTGSVNKILRQPDGKFLFCGTFTSYNGITRRLLARTDSRGNLDMNFYTTTSGFRYENNQGRTAVLNTMALLPNGKLLIGGRFNAYENKFPMSLARLNANGSLDTTFNAGGVNILKGLNPGIVYSIVVQPDGKILVGGDFDSYNQVPAKGLVRLNANGTIDATFNAGGAGFGSGSDNGVVETLLLQANGRIVAGGRFSSYNGQARNMLLRLFADGTPDLTFNQAGMGFNTSPGNVTVHVVAADTLGHLHVGGNFNFFNNTFGLGYLKLDTAGNLLNVSDEYLISDVYDLQPVGDKVYCAGNFIYYANGFNGYGLIRLDSYGLTDTTLDIRTGFRYDAMSTAAVKTLLLQGDSLLITGGRFKQYKQETRLMALSRIRTDGTLDTTIFVKQAAFNSLVNGMAVQQDQKVIAVGSSYFYNNAASPRIVRLNTDGQRDTSFHVGIGFNNTASCVVVQPDGKIIVGGRFTAYHDTLRSALVRLNPDGSLDNSFNIGTGFYANTFNNFYSDIYALVLLPNGQLLVGGDFKAYNGTSVRGLVRLNADGSLDNSLFSGFDPFSAIVTTLAVQNDGKILVGGSFQTYNGLQAESLIRLNADGTADASFDQSGTALQYYTPPGTNMTYGSAVSVIKVQQDGKILVGGSFLMYNNTLVNNLVRLNANGSRDLSFNNSGSGFYMMPETFSYYNWGAVTDLYIQPDQKIIAVGMFQKYNGSPLQNLVRLNTDGSMDPVFRPVAGDNSTYAYNDDYAPHIINKIVALANNQVVIGGEFPDCNKVVRGNIARLNNAGAFTPVSLVVSTVNNVPAVINQVQGTLALQAALLPLLSDQAVTWSSANTGTATVSAGGMVTAVSNGTVWVKAVSVANAGLSDSIQVQVTNQGTGITERAADQTFKAYPNPATDHVMLWCSEQDASGTLTLTDIRGAVLSQQAVRLQQHTSTLDMRGLNAGIYFIVLETAKGRYQAKIVKQ